MISTVEAVRATPARIGSVYPRAGWYFAAALAITVAGFYPSYFARLGQAKPVHHFHGLVATAWMVLLVVQAFLARHPRRWRLHRGLGRCSLVVAVLLVVSGALVVGVMLEGATPFNRMFGARLAFIDITTLGFFAAAIVLALVHRRDQPLHARWMATTALLALPPGLARLVAKLAAGQLSFPGAIHVTYALCGIVVAALLADDRKTGGLRAPYLALAALFVSHEIAFVLIPRLT